MDSSDQLTLQDLADTRSVVAKMRRRSLVAAGLGGIIFSATIAAFWIWHRPSQPGIAVFLAAASFCAVGIPLLLRWTRHWKKVGSQLSSVEQQLRSGGVVYGSQDTNGMQPNNSFKPTPLRGAA